MPGGRPRYDFSVVSEDGVRGLRVRSRDEHYDREGGPRRPARDADPRVELEGGEAAGEGDVRKKETSDLTGHVLVAWPRMPALLRTRLIGYVWEPPHPPAR